MGLYDHAIFATYSLAFMSLFVVLLAVLGTIGVGSDLLFFAAFVIPPLHLYKQLKGAYRLGRPGGLWRTAWMLLFTSTMFVLLLTMGVAK